MREAIREALAPYCVEMTDGVWNRLAASDWVRHGLQARWCSLVQEDGKLRCVLSRRALEAFTKKGSCLWRYTEEVIELEKNLRKILEMTLAEHARVHVVRPDIGGTGRMRIVPLSHQTVEGAVVQGAPLSALSSPILAGQPMMDQDLLPPRLLDGNVRKELKPPDLCADKTPVVELEQIAKFLEGLGFAPTRHSDMIVMPTNIPGVNLEIRCTPAGAMKAHMRSADGQVHAELSHFTQPADLLHFLHDHQIAAPKVGQRQETCVRRPLQHRPLVEMGL